MCLVTERERVVVDMEQLGVIQRLSGRLGFYSCGRGKEAGEGA